MSKICSIDGCGKPSVARSFCSAHVARYYKHGNPLGGRTNSPSPDTCVAPDCGRIPRAKGYCNLHYQRLCKHGDPLREPLDRPNGSGWVNGSGYVLHTVNGEQRLEHVLIAEKAIGKALPFGSEVHHVDECKSNNVPTNLVICPSAAYHKLLHARSRAYDACGNANWRKCWICQRWDDPTNLRSYKGRQPHHRDCHNRRVRGNAK